MASPVGVNKIIIEEGINGFIAYDLNEWKNALRKLLEDAALRSTMGKAGRVKMVTEYSIASQKNTFLKLFT